MSKQDQHFYEFGPYRIGTVERLLLRGEEVVPLTPKAVDTLLALVSNAGRVLEKDELMKTVWPDTFVEEGGLARNISLLRKALGDGPDDSRYIETIPRRGYRFVAAVHEPVELQPAAESPLPATQPARRKWLAAVLAMTAVAAIAVFVYVRRWHGPPPPVVKSLAVLPLENLSHDPNQDYFSEGMTEAFITELAKVDNLRVIRGRSGAPMLLRGSVLRAGERVRINVQLVDAGTGAHVWAEKYERDLRDVLALENEVAAAVAREIRLKLVPHAFPRVDPEAYQAYLKGRFFWNRRTEPALRQAITHFEQAIAKDPGYAPAHAGLADAYALLGSSLYDALPPREAMPRAIAAARRALQIDDTLAEAHTSLAYAHFSYEWDWKRAEQEFQRALALNLSYPTAHHWRAHYYLALGHMDDALAEIEKARVLDPTSLIINTGVGWCLYHSRQYDTAIQQYRKTLEMEPAFFPAHYALGLVNLKKQSYSEAIGGFEKLAALAGDHPATIMALGYAYAAAGRRPEARRELGKLQSLAARGRYVPALYAAFLHAGLGERDRAIEKMNQALEERSEYLIYLKVEPLLDDLRSDPRFPALLRRVGL